ncbi:type IV pilus twitching motility protein PilT [Deinococcus maricopensis]|uniref:Twitching motility protein n=1 Tax=Deinococcus maricopensis (strain DSM 21211 / LMG 22137 / NRRL B-23946 / LB-34) TaxID=709986 RepID=E8U7N9_DEIML|nr:PilT/PilU family type 4a pilus ATPase [Deinococcus maricopensis]ADV67078.1 twitching motility protein [Deinococcus maricopensis DSM 21211]
MVQELLTMLVREGASDIHIRVGSPPCYRQGGRIVRMDSPPLTRMNVRDILAEMLPGTISMEDFEQELEADFAYAIDHVARFRVNAFFQRGSAALVLRVIKNNIPDFRVLGLPEQVMEYFAAQERGLILVTGPTGSGKTTTLASLIDYINGHDDLNIITIEDPIEILHPNKRSLIAQRELGADTKTFAKALRAALRQDPDVILIGEMRDKETVEAALSAAQTGHLVLSTLHTQDAVRTVNRVIDFFQPHERDQIRLGLAESLVGIMSQRLLPRKDGGRVAGLEILIGTPLVRDQLKEEEKTPLIREAMIEGSAVGMQTFEQHLVKLVEADTIRYQDALLAATSPTDLRTLLMRAGLSERELLARDEAEENAAEGTATA